MFPIRIKKNMLGERMLRRQLFLGVASGLLVGQATQARIVSDLIVPKVQKLRLNAQAYYPLIEVHGTAYERGKHYGTLASEAIKRNIAFYSAAFKKSANIDWQQAQNLAKKFLPVIEKFCPTYIEEMKGIAAGSRRSFEDILTLNCRSEVLFAKADACSCIIIPSERGKNGHVFMGQTWDWMASARQNSVVLKVHQEGEPTILMICEAGMVGGKGLNSEGISICLNATSVGKGKIGVPLHLMMRKVLDSSLATEAIKAVSMLLRAGSGAFNIATRSDFEMILEFSPDQFDVIMSKREPLIHTNHYLSPLIAPFDKAKSFIPSTFTRYNTMEKWLKKHSGKIGEKEIFNLLSNHDNYPESICYHEDPRITEGERYCSVYAMVMDVTSGKLWVTDGYPCEGKVSEYQL